MKINKKYIIALLLCIFVLSNANMSYAFSFRHGKRTQSVSAKIKSNSKQVENTYTNETHSIFSLKDCIEIAMLHNPAIRASLYNEDVYKSKIGQAWSSYFPQIAAGIDVSRSGNKYNKEIPPYNRRSVYSTMGYVPSISADMMIFDFGKTKATADMAKRMYEATQEDTKEYINNVIYRIKTAYYNILFAQAQVKVYEDTVNDYQLQQKQATGFYTYGVKPKIDVITAEYNLGKAKLNLVKAKNVLEVAQIELSKIMGIPEYTNYELSDQMHFNKYEISVDDAVNKAFEVRPELLSAAKNLEASKMNLRAARREFTPNIGIYGSYGNGLGNEYNVQSTQVGVGLNYTSLNLALLKKQVDEAKASYEMNKALYEDTRDNVYFNIKKNYLELETASEAIVIAKLALEQAKEQYRQVTGRYKAGVGNAIELKDGENTYLNARLDFYNAVLNYNITAASLEKEIGVPLEPSDKKVLEITSDDL